MGKIRRTHIYTKGGDQTDKYIYYGEDQTDTYIYTIRLNSMTPLKQRGKIRRTYIYTKGEDPTETYIY